MDWRRTFSVHPPEAESGAPEASPPHTPPLSVDSAMDLSSDDSSILSASLLSLGEVPRSWVELNARIEVISDDSSLLSLGEVPRSRVEPNACIKECIEGYLPPEHSPSPARHVIPLLQVVSDPVISSQDFDVILPFCCQKAPMADLPTTTTYLETSQQDDTGVPSPTINTRGRFRKCLTNIFSSMLSCFRSRYRVVVLVGEADTLHWLDINIPKPDSEPVPAAKRGWLQGFLRRFRRTSRKG